MTNIDRRRFLQLAGGTAAMTALSTSIARAAAVPADPNVWSRTALFVTYDEN